MQRTKPAQVRVTGVCVQGVVHARNHAQRAVRDVQARSEPGNVQAECVRMRDEPTYNRA